MSSFADTQHPRAAAGTTVGGQFVAKARTESAVDLAPAGLDVPDGVSDVCRLTLDVLAPMGLRGRVAVEAPRSDGWTWFTIQNNDDEMRIDAHWGAAYQGTVDERFGLDSFSVYLTAPFGEPDHAGSESSTYSGSGISPGDAQAIVRQVVLTAAMQEEAGRRWPDLAGTHLGPDYPLTVSAEPVRSSWRRATDPEPAMVPGARLAVDGGEALLKVFDDELIVELDGVGAVDSHPYLQRVVCSDIAAHLAMGVTGDDATAALHNWLVDAQRGAYDSPVYHRFFG